MTDLERRLAAYVDGELPADDVAGIEALLAERPELRLYVEEQRMLAAGFRRAFSPVVAEEVPEWLRRAVAVAPVSLRWRWRRWLTGTQGTARSGHRFLVPGLALACGFGLGLVVPDMLANSPLITPGAKGELTAQGVLAETLDKRLAQDDTGTGPAVGVSFKTADGTYCRSFTAAAQAGVACHEDGEWRITALSDATPESGSYKPAASSLPAPVRAAIATSISGEPLDKKAERAARDQGWKGK